MNPNELKAALEALLFVAEEPLTLSDFKKYLTYKPHSEEVSENPDSPESAEIPVEAQVAEIQSRLDDEISKSDIKQLLEELALEYSNSNRGFELVEVAKGYQFRTKAAQAELLRNYFGGVKQKLSTPSLETLSIVAYQQPLTKLKLEEIRGVDSSGVLKSLLERDLIRIVGRSDEPGRPILYGTTRNFLEIFSLESLGDLPTLRDLELSEQKPLGEGLAEGGEELQEPGSEIDESLELDVSQWSEESDELLSHLEDSIQNLKETEKKILEQTNPPKPTENS